MLELYHYGFSTCSQKVRLVLAEKKLDFVSHEIDLLSGGQHDPEYVKLNPNHVVPTLVHDGTVLLESTLIGEYLDEAFPEVPMRPSDPGGRHAVRLWTKVLDEKVHGATAAVTFALGPRTLLLQQPPEVREANIAAIPDAKDRATRRSVVERGVQAPEFAGALRQMIAFLDRIEASLAPGGWLSGASFGLADAAALPYVLRLDHLAMTPLVSRDVRPALADWYGRVRSRPCYETAVAQWTPTAAVEFLQASGAAVWPEVESLVAARPTP
jgi:glutathione S-transferase